MIGLYLSSGSLEESLEDADVAESSLAELDAELLLEFELLGSKKLLSWFDGLRIKLMRCRYYLIIKKTTIKTL